MDTEREDSHPTRAQQLAQLEALEARHRQWQAQEEERRRQQQEREAAHAQWLAEHPPEDPEALRARIRAESETTPAQLHQMLGRDSYPTWVHAAYADLAGRMARVEALLQELEASISLLHAKMETLIVQQALGERRDDEE
jgi:uncharacterized protein YecE (DUF72 family)